MNGFAQDFVPLFDRGARPLSGAVWTYLAGLCQASKANMEKMEESVPDSNYQSMQYMLSESNWDEWAVMDEIARKTDALLGDPEDACLLLDESAFTKKGTESVGVSRQYNGRLGKVDNCQVGVFACLANGARVVPVYSRLFLPTSWTDQPERLQKAKVPREFWDFRTKPQIAGDLVKRARGAGVRFGWIAADSLYGSTPELIWRLIHMGETVVFDIRKNHQVYSALPTVYRPARKGSRGRQPKLRIEGQRCKVETLLPADAQHWEVLDIRDSTRGKLRVQAYQRTVWMVDEGTDQAQAFQFIATRNLDGKDLKMALANVDESVCMTRLAYMNRQRFWIERAFEEGKSNTGMAGYQARGWHSWHRHMTFVSMAMLFMEKTKKKVEGTSMAMISCADIRGILADLLPKRRVTMDEILRQWRERVRKRKRRTVDCYEKQGIDPPERYRG